MGVNSEDYVGEPLVVPTKMEIPSTRGGNALPQVKKEKIEMKRSILGVVAVYAFCFSSRASANFVYDINFGLAPGFLETGAITTSCDSCVLDSSRIVAWSFSNTSQSTPITSTDANAQILGNPENDLVATPQGVYFNFPDTNPANIYFSSVNGEFQLVTAGGPYAAPFADDSGYYTVCLPGNQICTLGVLEFSTLQLGMLQSSTVPLPATIWLLLSALGSLGMWLRRTSSTPSGLCLASTDPRQKLERPHGT
jgi:hypothetical protein